MYDFKIEQHAKEIMQMYRRYDEKAGGCPWLFSTEKDICAKCLESMKTSGLIADYDVDSYKLFL
jgi:hypothetical protein